MGVSVYLVGVSRCALGGVDVFRWCGWVCIQLVWMGVY